MQTKESTGQDKCDSINAMDRDLRNPTRNNFNRQQSYAEPYTLSPVPHNHSLAYTQHILLQISKQKHFEKKKSIQYPFLNSWEGLTRQVIFKLGKTYVDISMDD